MQENEFESTIRKKMEELQLVPEAMVWEKVSARIQKEKRRKRFFIFLITFIGFAVSGGMYSYLISNKPATVTAENNSVSSPNTKSKKVFKPAKKTNNSEEVIQPDKAIIITYKKQANAATIKKATISSDGSKQVLTDYKENSKAPLVFKSSPADGDSKRKKDQDKIEMKKGTSLSSKEKDENNRINPLINQSFSLQKTVIGKTNSVTENSLEKSIAETKKDSSKSLITPQTAVAKTLKIKLNKKWRVGFTVFSGVSNNVSKPKLFSFSNDNFYISPPNSSVGTPGSPGSGTALISKLTYASGFSFGFGAYAKKQVSKKISFTVGANYHFQSAASLVGKKNNTRQTFFDLNLFKNTTVNEYYTSGQTERFTNKYYLVELPLNVLIQLNKNEHKPVLVTAGISPAYLFSGNALYANYNQNVYYTDNTQFKKLQVVGQLGVQLPVFNGKHFQLTAGPEVQYGFNNMAKPATGTDQHLFSAGLKANITLP